MGDSMLFFLYRHPPGYLNRDQGVIPIGKII